MSRRLQFAMLFTLLSFWSRPMPAAEGDAEWQKKELQKLDGRWITYRMIPEQDGSVRRQRIELEFENERMNVYIYRDDKQTTAQPYSVKVLGVEKPSDADRCRRLKLDRVAFYYDFVKENLVLVGAIGYRPFEGFQFSGDYSRVPAPK